MMQQKYLPFTKQQLLSHFARVKRNGKCIRNVKHLEYYKNSIQKYNECLANNRNRLGITLQKTRTPCQIEKDERFWTAACMMTIFYDQNRIEQYVSLFKRAYGNEPPIETINTWQECFEGELYLFFEANLPSPRSYKKWLSENIAKRQFIPYVLDSAYNKKNLEGATNADAILLNSGNGFAVIIEAKVLSDISCNITYDVMRNQIARSIDVLLEKNDTLCDPLDKRDPEKTLFLMITPKLFKDNPTSRLYGYKFNEYKNNPSSLAQDLPHRKDCDWQNISKSLGWLSWEDFRNVNKDCCQWLE